MKSAWAGAVTTQTKSRQQKVLAYMYKEASQIRASCLAQSITHTYINPFLEPYQSCNHQPYTLYTDTFPSQTSLVSKNHIIHEQWIIMRDIFFLLCGVSSISLNQGNFCSLWRFFLIGLRFYFIVHRSAFKAPNFKEFSICHHLQTQQISSSSPKATDFFNNWLP